MVSEYLTQPLRSEEEVRQTLFKIAKEGARPHQIQAALERCNLAIAVLHGVIDLGDECDPVNVAKTAIEDLQYIESQLRAMS